MLSRGELSVHRDGDQRCRLVLEDRVAGEEEIFT